MVVFERNREADDAGYSADLFGGGSGLNEQHRLLQIYGVDKAHISESNM